MTMAAVIGFLMIIAIVALLLKGKMSPLSQRVHGFYHGRSDMPH